MLLYDRVHEIAARMQRAAPLQFGSVNDGLLYALRSAQVFLVDRICRLKDEWEEVSNLPIPKKPPFDYTWTEYTDENHDSDISDLGPVEVGSLFFKRDKKLALDSFKENKVMSDDERALIVSRVEQAEAIWSSHTFLRLPKPRTEKIPPNEIFSSTWAHIWFLHDDLGERLDFKALTRAGRDHLELRAEWPISICPLGVRPIITSPMAKDKARLPWPSFLAFALLNCKNVVTEEIVPSAKVQHGAKKAGSPPRTSYKVLKVEVPAKSRRQTLASVDCQDEEESVPMIREHVVRGHPAHLVSQRYKGKRGHWIWRQAHIRGSASVGEIRKDYRVVPAAD